jgi:hypothetical protein
MSLFDVPVFLLNCFYLLSYGPYINLLFFVDLS